ncbi:MULTISPECIES: riboflavin synthase [Hyphomonas]|uniref:Riboflavin synthase n=3 Tax=Hyphomonas adhaerens TaxID=81029 RepID=A0A069E179_9PROT|nr:MULTISPECIES: riboflavin synthase [Hyphomonas]KCZ83426.1 riboflavin synthase subunit alpha [Hyphomonas adhaerens MHS-3]MBB38680.1 riboflavin synthase [Hyphomonas sp.]|tara:strand:- start:8947 stop:9567 length:621 start_codon:yes stop_codon:yes gene_type:complete
MFTGLVTDVGKVRKAEHRNGLTRFEVESGYPLDDIAMGASIMHSGVCLTVVDMGQGERGAWFAVEAIPETLAKTVLGDWNEGARVNLEQSLKLGDELGGHFVFGHVDGVGEIVSIEDEGQSRRITIRPPADIARYFATKGSAAVNGVSLTVANALPNGDFQVAVIPHTWEVTTLAELQPGSRVNLEIDMLARYVARMIGADAPEGQ